MHTEPQMMHEQDAVKLLRGEPHGAAAAPSGDLDCRIVLPRWREYETKMSRKNVLCIEKVRISGPNTRRGDRAFGFSRV